MSTAFVMINTHLGSEKEVLEKMRKIDEIKESCIVYGIHDMTAKISADIMDNLNKLIIWIRNLDKIKASVTLILIEGEK